MHTLNVQIGTLKEAAKKFGLDKPLLTTAQIETRKYSIFIKNLTVESDEI